MGRFNGTQLNEFPGVYVGQVVDRRDPLGIGRLKVYIETIHVNIGEDMVPWARPVCPFGTGYDEGSYVIPQTGSYVWVIFEGGDSTKPVYLGSLYSADSRNVRYFQLTGKYFGEEDPTIKIPEGETSRPRDITGMNPDKSIFFKSLKGATLLVDDRDGEEKLELIDRGGITLRMVSRMYDNSYSNRRGTSTYYDVKNRLSTNTELSYVGIKGKGYHLEFKGYKDVSKCEIAADRIKFVIKENKLYVQGKKNKEDHLYEIDLDKLEKLLSEVTL